MERLDEAYINLKKIIESSGFKISKVSWGENGFSISFYHPRVFEKVKKEKGEGFAYHYALSGCVVDRKNDGKISMRCNIVNPVRKMIEFHFLTDEESFRPHFLPKDDIVGVEIVTKNPDRISEILSSFLNAI